MGRTAKTWTPDLYAVEFHRRDKTGARIMPRVMRRDPRRGDVHPFTPADVRNVLRTVPPAYVYGLKSVELRARPRTIGDPFGLYQRDERRIHLYSCPPSRWVLEGARAGTGDGLSGYGAIITSDAARIVIEWPDPLGLWNFYLDTLLHELGHHHVNQYEASRGRPGTRRRNEALADLHADKILKHVRRLLAKSGDA